jgi:hypothetical protein
VVAVGRSSAEWSEPTILDSTFNGPGRDHFPFISADGKRLYWSSDSFAGGFGSNEDIYVAAWDSSLNNWGPRQLLGPEINTSARELSPCETPDRQYLWFTRYNGVMSYDLYYSVWDTSAGKWGNAVNAGSQFNSPCMEWSVSISPDGKRLFLVHGIRPGAVGCEGEVLWVTYWNDTVQWWDSLIWMGDHLNRSAGNFSAAMSLDTTYLLIASGGTWPNVQKFGLSDIFSVSYNPLLWDSVHNLGEPPSSPELDNSLSISADGQRLYFSSTRNPQSIGGDIYVSFSSDVGVLEFPERPAAFNLGPAFPNPFNSSTYFTLTVDTPSRVIVSVHNILGQHLETLANGRFDAGQTRLQWNAADLPSGLYLIMGSNTRHRVVREVVLVK